MSITGGRTQYRQNMGVRDQLSFDDPVFLDLHSEGRAGDAQYCRGLCYVPVCMIEHLRDMFRLDLPEAQSGLGLLLDRGIGRFDGRMAKSWLLQTAQRPQKVELLSLQLVLYVFSEGFLINLPYLCHGKFANKFNSFRQLLHRGSASLQKSDGVLECQG